MAHDSSSEPVDDVAVGPNPIVGPTADNLVYESRIEYEGTDEVAVIVVDAIANIRDMPVTDLVGRIDDAVDPDALDRIVRPLPDGTARSGWVTFHLCDCLVRLSGDGRLQIFDGREGSGD